jgi:predicted TIM-barrel fold metal-dependent hydrolase
LKLFDSHFHIINTAFPLTPNHGFLPTEFTVEDYQTKLAAEELAGGAVVSGSFQGFDQQYLIDALNKLGPGYCGVANIPGDCSEKELNLLDAAGVRAVRFNLVRGGSAGIKDMEFLSKKLFQEFGWHSELYLDSTDIPDLLSVLKRLEAFSIDHLGLSSSGLSNLYQLVDMGAQVKATGFGRLDFDPVPVMQQIMKVNPGALMFGTDLPSTRAKVAFTFKDLDLIKENFSLKHQQMILYQNAFDWYHK